MPTDTQVNDLKINVLSEAQYEQIQSPSSTELYLVPEVVDTTPTSESTNTITSGGVYNALQSLPEGVFMCNYNTSTHTMDKTPEQILQAKENGMAVLCKDGTTRVYHCTAANQSTIFFECLYSDNSSNLIYIIKWVSNSGWTTSSKLLQDKLVSSGNSQNIKTINNTSLLGSGNIDIDAIKTFKGWFDTETDLNNAYPSPVVGNYAYVADAAPATTTSIYECATAGTWSDSGRTVDTSSVQTFETLEPVNDVSIVNDLTTGGGHDVLSAEQGKFLGDSIFGTLDFYDSTPSLNTDSYYAYNASSNSINVNRNSHANDKCCRLSVNPGDKFKIFGKSLSNASAFRLWCFSDGTNTNNTFSALSVANAYIDTRQNGVVITAPEGSVYLTINFAAYDSEQDKIQKLKRADDGLVGKVKFSSGQNLNEVSIVDSFDSDSANDVLSAKQGKTIGDTLYDKFAWQDDMEDLESNHYYNTSGGAHNMIDSSSLQLNGTSCIRLSCKEGDKFKIFGKGNSGVIQLYVFTNSYRTILYKPDTAINSRATGLEVTAPANSGYLYINFYEYDSNTDKVQKQVLTSEGLVTKVIELEEDLTSAFPLNDKNIVVFGDSLSEFKYNSKGWCDYAAEISKANFINCAIGGTQFRQRRDMITLFDSSKNYNVGDWVYYKPSTTMNCYECVAEHSGAWNDDDFDEVAYNYYIYSPLDIVNIVKAATNTDIEVYADRFVNQEAAIECVKDHNGDDNTAIMNRLKAIDWSTVGAVVCMAGANDFNDKQYGTSGSTDISKTLGAINEIIRMLNSTYKNIPIYLATDTVRWFNYSSGSGVDSDWCDVYVPSGGTLTYKEFFAAIINEGKNNHIPVIDLYNELGWNKWNFSNFFTDNDGTHPLKGFRQIAEKIVSFIISNKVF